jgi:DNA-binding response OmpR family regulator
MGNPPSVLIIDDDCSMRLTLSVIVEDEGYQVLTAADGDEGLTLVRASAVDVAVVDMKMPGLSGDEVCAAIKAVRPSTEVIMITAHVADDMADRAMVAGAHSIIYKPLDIDELLARISELGEHAGHAHGQGPVLAGP